jgi:hypothetical protein
VEQVSPSGLSSISLFVVKAFFLCIYTQSTLQNQNDWNATQSYLVGGGNPLPCLPLLVAVSHLYLTSLDGTEIGPGTLLGPGGTPISSSTGPTGTSTSSTSSSSTPVPASGHSSNTGAIAGGVVGGLAAIIVAIASVFFCRRGRHTQTPAPTSIDERPSGFNSLMDQVPRSMSGPGTVASSMPDTDPSMLRFYVCIWWSRFRLCALMYFVSVTTLRIRMTQLRSQISKHLRRRRCIRVILWNHLRDLHRFLAKVHTSLTPRRTLKDKHPDMVAYPNPETTSRLARMHRYFYPSVLLLNDSVSKPKKAGLARCTAPFCTFSSVNLLSYSLI